MKTLLVAAMMVVPVSVAAEENKDRRPELCAAFEEIAEAIMLNRQQGASLSRMMELIPKAEADDEIEKLARMVVLAAYEEPRYSSSENQRKAVEDFRNKVVLACWKSIE